VRDEVCVVRDDHQLEVALFGPHTDDLSQGVGQASLVVLIKIRLKKV
jgi:hypothetical protein